MKDSGLVQTVFRVVKVLLIVAAVVLVARLVGAFFGALSSAAWFASIEDLTEPLIWDFGFSPVTTPYGGVFELNTVLALLIVIVAEFVVGALDRTLRTPVEPSGVSDGRH